MAEPGVLQPKPTDVFVSPLVGLHPIDVNASVEAIDKWLRGISGGWITVGRLKSVGENVPILANIFAATDAVLDIKAMIEHGEKPVDAFDWLNLGVDLIGVVPLPPGTAELRVGARPLLKLLRQEMAKSGKSLVEGAAFELRDAVVSAMVANLNERYAGEIETFMKRLRAGLAEVLNHSAECIAQLMNAFADLFAVAAGDKPLSVTGNLHAAAQHAEEVEGGFKSYDGRRMLHGVSQFMLDFAKIECKAVINVATAAGKMADKQFSADLMRMSTFLRERVPEVTKRVRELDGNDVGKIGWLISIGEQGVMRWRQRAQHNKYVVAIPEKGSVKVVHEREEGRVETTRHTAPAEHPGAGPCKKGCPIPTPPAATTHSIGFALGDERIEHEDFVLEGPLPIVWQRTYRSFFDANDERGELGARWITPYATRFDVRENQLVYHGADGRSLTYPMLAPEEAYKDLAEDLSLVRLDGEKLLLMRGRELLETFERRGDTFRLSMVRTRAGHQIVLDYDAQGRLLRLITPQLQVGFTCDERGRIVQVSHHSYEGDRLGVLARYVYDEAGDLVTAFDRYENKRQYQYKHHLVTRYTDRTGRGVNLEWIGAGPKAKCVREYADDGSDEVRLAWHPDMRRVFVTDALGGTTQYDYDLKGYPFRVVYADGSEEWMYRDANDNLTQYIHRDGSVERLGYDERGNLTRHHRTDGSLVEFAYDEKDQLTRLTDPHGQVWQRAYDQKGNVSEQIDPLGHKTEYRYDSQGRLTEIKDAKGGSKALAYNDAGLLTSYKDCSGKTTKWNYDPQGRLTETKDAEGGTTTLEYGPNGHPIVIHSPSGVEQLTYDAEGRLLSHTDGLSRTTRYTYDEAGRIARRRDALDQTLAYGYDRLGRLTALTDQNGATYRFAYDPVGRLLEETAFDGKVTRYTYHGANGRLLSVEEAGQVTQFEHDRGGRLSRRVADGIEERFMYDQSGRLLYAQNGYSTIERFFDSVGNLIREHHAYRVFGEPTSYVWHHRYDELGTRIQTIRPDGHTIDWLTYGSGHVHGMLLNGEEHMHFERDNLHRELKRVFPSKLTQTTAYDAAGRLLRRAVQRERAPAPLAERNYRYDAAGQLTEIEDGRKGYTHYRYDPLGRLIEATSPIGRERFAFDPASNIVDLPPAQETRTSSSYVTARQESTLPPQVPKVLGNLLQAYAGTRFAYDARGNLIHRRSTQGEQSYEWDAFNRLHTARVEETTRRSAARYYYDALGRRIAKDVNGTRTLFGWDGDTLAYETTEEGATHYVYEAGSFVPLVQFVADTVHGIPTPVWRPEDHYLPEEDPLRQVPQRTSEAHVFYYHCDQIGTPLTMTDELGEVVWEASYKAWGEAQQVIARASKAAGIAPKNPLRFQGQQHDEETGLAYNRHRYYDAASGRFISKDPIGIVGGINVYAYAPNPIQWIDPRGLSPSGAAPSGKSASCPRCNPCEGRNPAAVARDWQGSTPYDGVDSYANVVVKKGTVLYTLFPHGPAPGNYFVKSSAVMSARSAREYNDSVQVAHTGNWASPKARDMRTRLHAYVVMRDTCMAAGTARNNPHLGAGGATQYFIENRDKANLLDTGRIASYAR